MKTIICMSFIMMTTFCSFAQNPVECVFCDLNTINQTVFASGIGTNNTATGSRSFVGGEGSLATGNYSLAFGFQTSASGLYSLALGRDAEASGNYSVAIGRGSKASDGAAFALGYMNIAQVESSYLFGAFLKSTAGGSVTIGFGAGNDYLVNNKPYSLMVGFRSIYPTLYVQGQSSLNDDKTGRVGIGNITSPTAKLHIKADDNEDATIRLEVTGSNKYSRLYFSDEVHISASPQNNLSFTLPQNKNLIFETGNVGIGTTNPQAKLQVQGSMILGENSLANGSYSFAGGSNSQATGNYSLAFGFQASATETSTIAMGYKAKAHGMYSVAIGRESEVNGDGSFAIGLSNQAQSGSSYLMGELLKSMGSSSITLGFGASISQPLVNNKANSLMIGFRSIYPTLYVQGQSSQNNDKTGKVGIGNITSPTAKLHIKADDNEDASLKLEPTGAGKLAVISLGNNGHEITARADGDMKFTTQPGNNFVYESGNVGVGTSAPVAKLQVKDGDIYIEDINRGIIMKSPDGNCWRGKLNNSGELQFEQIDCNMLVGITFPSGNKTEQHVQIYPNPAGDKVYISIDDRLIGSLLEIFDGSGRIMTTEILHNRESIIDLKSYKTGLYFFNVKDRNGKEVETVKVVKN